MVLLIRWLVRVRDAVESPSGARRCLLLRLFMLVVRLHLVRSFSGLSSSGERARCRPWRRRSLLHHHLHDRRLRRRRPRPSLAIAGRDRGPHGYHTGRMVDGVRVRGREPHVRALAAGAALPAAVRARLDRLSVEKGDSRRAQFCGRRDDATGRGRAPRPSVHQSALIAFGSLSDINICRAPLTAHVATAVRWRAAVRPVRRWGCVGDTQPRGLFAALRRAARGGTC